MVTPCCWAGGETGQLILFSNVIYHALLGGCAVHLLINPAYLFLFLSFLSLLLSLFHIENQKDAGELLYMHYKLLGLLSYIYFVFHSSLRYVLLQAENGDALILKELICAVYVTSFVSILRIECRLEVPCSNSFFLRHSFNGQPSLCKRKVSCFPKELQLIFGAETLVSWPLT